MSSIVEKLPEIKELFAGLKDPLFKAEAASLITAMELATKYKKIDMTFLQMVDQELKIPKFAILPYDLYVSGQMCTWKATEQHYEWCEQNGMAQRFGELFRQGQYSANPVPATPLTDQCCSPTKKVPETIAAQVAVERKPFDEVFVAWEAEWLPKQEDPIVIGRKGKFHFIIATWDLSKLESYVTEEFSL